MLHNKSLLALINWICMGLGFILAISSMYMLGYFLGKGDIAPIQALLSFVCWFLGLYLALILHELGHAFFGKLTGFRTVALGLGKNHVIQKDGKWNFERKLLVQGAAAQYVGVKVDESDHRAILMFSGGLIVHMALALIYAIFGIVFDSWSWFLPQISLNLALFVINVNPNGITDGAKILELSTYPEHTLHLFRELRHTAVVFTEADSANLADFVLDDVPLEAGITLQTAYLNSVEVNIIQGDLERADEKLQSVLAYTENAFIKLQADYQKFFIKLLLGEIEEAKTLARKKSIKAMFKQASAQAQIIKAYYEIVCLDDNSSATKSLKKAEQLMQVSHMLADEKAFYQDWFRKLQEKIDRK